MPYPPRPHLLRLDTTLATQSTRTKQSPALKSLPNDVSGSQLNCRNDSSSAAAAACSSPSSPLSPSPEIAPIAASAAASVAACEAAFASSDIVLLADRYLLLEPVEVGPAHGQIVKGAVRRCVDTVTEEAYVCRQVCTLSASTASFIEAHDRLKHSPLVTAISHVIHVHNDGDGDIDNKDQAPRSFLLSPTSYGDLHSYLRLKRRLKENEARHLFRQAAQAVHHCHSRGVVLTDLKLRRFVFADPQRTRLRLESLEDAIVLEKCDSDDGVWRKHGYPAYVTPEVLLSRGARYSGRAADLWSLGIILYTLLVGRYPFQDSGPFGLFTKIIRGHYTVPDFVSSRARCLIRNLLRRDPSQRLEASDILRHHWFSATLRPSKMDQLKNKPNEVVNAATGQLAARSEVNVFADQVVPEWKLNDQSNDVHHPHYRMPHC